MIRIFKTIDRKTVSLSEIEENSWIALTNPTLDELKMIAERFEIELDDLKSPLDEEERSRIEVEEDYTMIVLDIPATELRQGKEYFYTIPFGIILKDDLIFTVCLQETPILSVFMDGRVRGFQTVKRTKFLYQMLYHNATMYLQYLRIIDKKSDEVEEKLRVSQRNKDLIEIFELRKSLVYFTTSLRGNELVLERLMRNTSIPRYEEDEELLEDVIIENKQAIEMAKIYTDILNSTMDGYASIISNNLNVTMRFLSVITIVLTVPTIIGGAFGMNLKGIPFENHPYGFWIISGIALILTILVWIYTAKSKRFQ